jgi:hypothetical protein
MSDKVSFYISKTNKVIHTKIKRGDTKTLKLYIDHFLPKKRRRRRYEIHPFWYLSH